MHQPSINVLNESQLLAAKACCPEFLFILHRMSYFQRFPFFSDEAKEEAGFQTGLKHRGKVINPSVVHQLNQQYLLASYQF